MTLRGIIPAILNFRRLTLGKGAVLYRSARIRNIHGDREAISVGPNSHVLGELLTFAHGGRIEIGEYCYVGEQARIWSACNIKIGNRVLISHSVNIFDNATHPIAASERHAHFKRIVTSGHPKKILLNESPVLICDDVWVGCASIILKGVTIGEGAVIGAGSVVTKDVPPWTVVAGNPAKVIRELGPDER